MIFVAPLPPNAANARQNWRVALVEKKAYWEHLNTLLTTKRLPAPPEVPPRRVVLRAKWFLWNMMDDDNAMRRLKPLLDWLVGHGYLSGDSRKQIKWVGIPDQVIDRENQRVELTIEENDDAQAH